MRVHADQWRLDGCPDSGPALQYVGNRLYVAWYTEAAPNAFGIKLAWSDDSAKSFNPPVLASGNILDVNHPAFSLASDGTLFLTFQGRDPDTNAGWSPPHAYLVEIKNGSSTGPQKVPGNEKPVSYPTALAATGGRIFVAWTEPGVAERTIAMTRGRSGS